MITAIKKNPIIAGGIGLVLVAAGILLYQYSFFNNGIKGVRNTIDCKKIKSVKRTYNEKLAICKTLFQRDSTDAINDSDCVNICQQILECEALKSSESIADLKRFLSKYKNAPKVDCYQDAQAQLDHLRCEEARNAPDTVRRLSMQQYLEEFGETGICSLDFESELETCEAILKSDSCLLLYDYLNTKGEAGACYYEVSNKYYQICINNPDSYGHAKLDSAAYEKAKAADDCEEYRKYLILHPNGKWYQEIRDIMQKNCPDTPIPIRPSDANAFGIPVRPEDASVTGGRINKGVAAMRSSNAGCKTYTVGGQTFQATKIGPLLVMCENLNVPMYNSICYNYDARNCQQYGELYTYPEAMAACPQGWRLPCESEIDFLLSTYYSNPQSAFENMSHWAKMQYGGLAAGNTFMNAGTEGYFWCATEASDTEAYYYKFDNWQKTINNGDVLDKTYKLSCRCVSVADEREYVASRISRIRCHNQPN